VPANFIPLTAVCKIFKFDSLPVQIRIFPCSSSGGGGGVSQIHYITNALLVHYQHHHRCAASNLNFNFG